MSNDQITVRELIERLQKLSEEHQSLLVETEGCDCYGPCSGIRILEEGIDKHGPKASAVLLLRSKEY